MLARRPGVSRRCRGARSTRAGMQPEPLQDVTRAARILPASLESQKMNHRINRAYAMCTAVLLLVCVPPSSAFDGIRLTPLGGAESVDAAPVAVGSLVEAS